MHFIVKFLFSFSVNVMQFAIDCQFIFCSHASFITQMKTDYVNQTHCKKSHNKERPETVSGSLSTRELRTGFLKVGFLFKLATFHSTIKPLLGLSRSFVSRSGLWYVWHFFIFF